jgi:L-arabinose isomerase
MSCQFCGKQFNRGYNLRRHEKEYCPLGAQERNMSQTDSDSHERDFQDAFSTTSTEVSEISAMTDNESETEEEMDPWIPLIEEAKQRSYIAFEEMNESLINSDLDEQSAKDKAYSNILPKLQKELENIYMERLLWMKQLKSLNGPYEQMSTYS